jgi:hypothetical protein
MSSYILVCTYCLCKRARISYFHSDFYLGCLNTAACMRSRLRGFRLRNYFRSLYYYSLFATCYGCTTIFMRMYNTLEINTTDNGSVVFLSMLANFVDNNDRFLVMVDSVAVVELTIACSGCTWRSLISALSMFMASVVTWIPLVSRLTFSYCVAKCVSCYLSICYRWF